MAGQQGRKESRAAMSGRQNGKGKEVEGKKVGLEFCRVFSAQEFRERLEKGKRKEVEGKKVGHQFCTVFSAQESGERLRIPPSFSQYLQNQPTGQVSLKGQSGNTWPAELTSDTEGLFFGHGWKEFVMDHSIATGHILTFCYDGLSQFSVVVFDGMCIEKPSAFHAKPSKDLVFIESDEEDNEITAAPQEENNGTKYKRTRERDARGLEKNNKTEGPGASVGYKSANINSTEDSDSSNRLLEERIPRNDSSKSSPVFRFSKDMDESGKTVVKVQRGPEVTSQRLPVSEEQKNYALQKAKNYKSKYPITLAIMKDTNVYKSFFMIIPCEFVREYLPHTDKKLTLWDPQGKAWEVTYVYCSKHSAGAFSKGWGKFSLGNHLEKFDVCVFELFSEDNIKVHIYRANPALTPYTLDSNKL